MAEGDSISLTWPNISIVGVLLIAVLLPAGLAVRGKLIGFAMMKIMLADKDKQIENLTKALQSKDRTLEMQAQVIVNDQEMIRTMGHFVQALPAAVEAHRDH
jgi:hypothetical protein